MRTQYIQALSRNTEMSREKTVEIRKVRIEGIIIQKPGKIKKPPN